MLQTQTNNMSHTALGCQQNYWQKTSGHQRGCRKSIICQHLTRVFRVVKHCAQADNYPSVGYKGLKAWFGLENKGSIQLTTSLFKILPDWSGMRDNINWREQERRIMLSILKHKENILSVLISVCGFCQLTSMTTQWSCFILISMTLELLDFWGLSFIERERNM